MTTADTLNYVSERNLIARDRRAGLSVRQFEWIASTVYDYCGIHLPPAKHQSVEGRLAPRVRALGMSSLSEYQEYLTTEEGRKREFVHFIDCITINKTEFFREAAHFRFLTERVLPELAETAGVGRRYPLRIWSAGCSTGEEAYTIALAISEYAMAHPPYRFSVLATDISQRALDRAVRAIYPLEAFEAIPQALRRRYLLRNRDSERSDGRIGPAIRELVEFRRLNLMDNDLRTVGAMDVIFCRNVMIYFTKSGREALIGRLIDQLRVGGHLFLGHSETLHTMTLPVAAVAPTVFKKVA